MSTINREDKIKIIDDIIGMFPELKKHKDDIIKNICDTRKQNTYIFNKHVYLNQELYVDPEGNIFDKNLNFKGLYIDNIYYLTDNNIDLLDITKYDIIIKYNN